jgi:glycosyltransferase involved in cell wall biosynthesis
MTQSPRASVIVPLYQKARTVRRCIDSILAQRFQAFELVVVDDGSTDGGERIAASYDDPRLRVVRQANAGPGAARNRGVRETTAEYVAFLDADDEWDPGYLEYVVARLDADPAIAAVSCSYSTPDAASMVPLWRRRGLRDGVFRVTSATSPQLLVAVNAYMHPCATTLRRAAFTRYGGFYERGRCLYGEDAFLFLQVVLNEPVAFSFESLARIDTGASDLSTHRRPRTIEPLFEASETLEASTPAELRPLLRDFLAIRAGKTACVMTYWNRLPEARKLVKEFTRPRDLRRRWVVLGRICASPIGSSIARALELARTSRAKPIAASQNTATHR